MRPVIKQIYSDDITCSDTDCFFTNPCPKVKDQYHHAALSFTLGTEGNEYEQVEIHIDLVNYLVAGNKLGKSADFCFLPIFVMNPDKNRDAFDTWFLGNMFLDKYFVIHDFEKANVDSGIKP